jgi:hypothetical protein
VATTNYVYRIENTLGEGKRLVIHPSADKVEAFSPVQRRRGLMDISIVVVLFTHHRHCFSKFYLTIVLYYPINIFFLYL